MPGPGAPWELAFITSSAAWLLLPLLDLEGRDPLGFDRAELSLSLLAERAAW